ncbi:hypothetical protein KUCAC02_006209 [Chaenocephalus aceratus]|nr:hypothetical protein KUCAC02_006209 [Chaenocephalus aceratus]
MEEQQANSFKVSEYSLHKHIRSDKGTNFHRACKELQVPSNIDSVRVERHEALTTLLAEVGAIMNTRPLGPISTDPPDPLVLTPATILTQKKGTFSTPPGDFTPKDLYKHHWRQVQFLVDAFCSKWRKQYLSTSKTRSKWYRSKANIDVGTIFLVKDSQAKRQCHWHWSPRHPRAKMKKVHIVEVKITRADGATPFLRPITDLVLLLSEED